MLMNLETGAYPSTYYMQWQIFMTLSVRVAGMGCEDFNSDKQTPASFIETFALTFSIQILNCILIFTLM